MTMKSVTLILLSFNLLSLCLGSYNNYYDSQPSQRTQYYQNYNSADLQWSGYSKNINEGSCSGNKVIDEEIDKEGASNTYKQTTFKYDSRGLFLIRCVKVVNRMPLDSKAGEVRIIEGGVGHKSVRIELRSQLAQNLNFHVEIWAEPTQQHSSVGVMTSLPNNVFIMNGKRYCEC